MSNARMQFEFNLGRARNPGARRDDEAPFRILVLAELSGAAAAAAGGSLRMDPMRVGVDNLDKVLARHAPRVVLGAKGSQQTVELRSLDDFHPDRLFRSLPAFASLRQLREELRDPARFRRAAAALEGTLSPEAKPSPAQTGDAAADVERLLGRPPQVVSLASPAAAVQGWLRELIAPYVVADTTHDQARLLAAVDAATAEQMRRVLHHPVFQSLEATWRGIAGLVSGIEDDERVPVYVLDASRAALHGDLRAAAGDLTRCALYRHLCGERTQGPDGEPWSLLVGDCAFGAGEDDIELLAALGALAARAGAPFLAAAGLDLLGCAAVERLPEPASWSPLQGDPEARWRALRKSSGAPFLGLALPRVLLRLPYGAKTDPIDSFAFEELPETRSHEAYLWGNPAFALARLAAQAFAEQGWDMDLAGHLEISDLPAHSYRDDGATKLQPCAEVLTGEPAAEAILARGIMPLMSYRNRNAARLARWQSLAEPAQALQGAWA